MPSPLLSRAKAFVPIAQTICVYGHLQFRSSVIRDARLQREHHVYSYNAKPCRIRLQRTSQGGQTDRHAARNHERGPMLHHRCHHAAPS